MQSQSSIHHSVLSSSFALRPRKMSFSQALGSAKPREVAPVYRCGDTHWHFDPHRKDTAWRLESLPWWLQPLVSHSPLPLSKRTSWTTISNSLEPPQQFLEEGKFWGGAWVYLKSCGNERFSVDDKYRSGFYSLNSASQPEQWCMGRYKRSERKLWREEELSETPWPCKQRTALPTYEESMSSAQSSSRDSG